jgi:hypothetical protein
VGADFTDGLFNLFGVLKRDRFFQRRFEQIKPDVTYLAAPQGIHLADERLTETFVPVIYVTHEPVSYRRQFLPERGE